VPNCGALTTQQKLGAGVSGQRQVHRLHSGPELTNASVQNVLNEKLERMIMGDEAVAVYDNGFYNAAVRRCAGLAGPCDDVGVGATIGPLNLPLSMSDSSSFAELRVRVWRWLHQRAAHSASPVGGPRDPAGTAAERASGRGRGLKTPGLRNVELTAPYFHNGGDRTLGDVVDFYNRGGNFPSSTRPTLTRTS